jgi:hypothetical protein
MTSVGLVPWQEQGDCRESGRGRRANPLSAVALRRFLFQVWLNRFINRPDWILPSQRLWVMEESEFGAAIRLL